MRDMVELNLFSQRLSEPYEVQSVTDCSILNSFVRAVQGESIDINNFNRGGLLKLCNELGFPDLLDELQAQEVPWQWEISILKKHCSAFHSKSKLASNGHNVGFDAVRENAARMGEELKDRMDRSYYMRRCAELSNYMEEIRTDCRRKMLSLADSWKQRMESLMVRSRHDVASIEFDAVGR